MINLYNQIKALVPKALLPKKDINYDQELLKFNLPEDKKASIKQFVTVQDLEQLKSVDINELLKHNV